MDVAPARWSASLRSWMVSNNAGLEDLARAVDCPYETVRRWTALTNPRGPGKRKLIFVCGTLGLNFDYIVGGVSGLESSFHDGYLTLNNLQHRYVWLMQFAPARAPLVIPIVAGVVYDRLASANIKCQAKVDTFGNAQIDIFAATQIIMFIALQPDPVYGIRLTLNLTLPSTQHEQTYSGGISEGGLKEVIKQIKAYYG